MKITKILFGLVVGLALMACHEIGLDDSPAEPYSAASQQVVVEGHSAPLKPYSQPTINHPRGQVVVD